MASSYQRAKRTAFWQTFGGGVLALAGMALWFMAGGMPEDCAKLAVTLIAKRQIPNVAITY